MLRHTPLGIYVLILGAFHSVMPCVVPVFAFDWCSKPLSWSRITLFARLECTCELKFRWKRQLHNNLEIFVFLIDTIIEDIEISFLLSNIYICSIFIYIYIPKQIHSHICVHILFYNHSVFQSEAQICLGFFTNPASKYTYSKENSKEQISWFDLRLRGVSW